MFFYIPSNYKSQSISDRQFTLRKVDHGVEAGGGMHAALTDHTQSTMVLCLLELRSTIGKLTTAIRIVVECAGTFIRCREWLINRYRHLQNS